MDKKSKLKQLVGTVVLKDFVYKILVIPPKTGTHTNTFTIEVRPGEKTIAAD